MHRQLLFICIIAYGALPLQLHAAQAKVVTAAKQKATPLERQMIDAAGMDNLKIVKKALNAGARIDATKTDARFVRSSSSWTALMFAAFKGHADIVKTLVTAKADLNIQDYDGWTALMLAISYNNFPNILHIESINTLVTAKADLNIQNIDGWTPLMFAARRGFEYDILILLNANADPYIVSYDAQTIRNNCLSRHYESEATKRCITRLAGKTFHSILAKEHPYLSQNPEIQQGLKKYEQRYVQYKTDVAKLIEMSIEEVHFLPVLADIVAEYAVEHVPAIAETSDCAKATTDREKKNTASWCVIS